MVAAAGDGPVLEVVKGPPHGVIYAAAGGTIAYDLTTRRHESCPGMVQIEYSRIDADRNESVDGDGHRIGWE
jgi:hypothetical protein